MNEIIVNNYVSVISNLAKKHLSENININVHKSQQNVRIEIILPNNLRAVDTKIKDFERELNLHSTYRTRDQYGAHILNILNVYRSSINRFDGASNQILGINVKYEMIQNRTYFDYIPEEILSEIILNVNPRISKGFVSIIKHRLRPIDYRNLIINARFGSDQYINISDILSSIEEIDRYLTT